MPFRRVQKGQKSGPPRRKSSCRKVTYVRRRGWSRARFAREFAPLFVPATQNPIEREGTCPLPEIQQDRFMFSLIIDYLPKDQELAVVIATTGAKALAVLRHRIVTNFRAESEGVDAEQIVRRLIEAVPPPKSGL